MNNNDNFIRDYFRELEEGKCPICHQETKHVQVGRCVYGEPCGHRLYQGKANPKFVTRSVEE